MLAAPAIVLLILAVVATSPAHAMTRNGACVWEHLPQDMREELMSEYQEDRLTNTYLRSRQADLDAASQACGMHATLPAKPLVADIVMAANLRKFGREGMTADAVLSAFTALPPYQQTRFEAVLATSATTRSAEDQNYVNSFCAQVIRDAGGEAVSPQARVAMRDYILAFGIVLYFEHQQ